jgi:hypothetical protein
MGDFVSQLERRLPPSMRLVVAEPGIADSIVELEPNLGHSLETVEHAILDSEWGEDRGINDPSGLRIGFLGQARWAKGFDVFVSLADATMRSDLEFHAIGLATSESRMLDLTSLACRPHEQQLDRGQYLAALQGIDLVCAPFQSQAYNFTASGTLSDAIAALKPVLALRNRVVNAIVAKYGPIGYAVGTTDELVHLVQTLDRADFQLRRPRWVENLRRIRQARRPEILASAYSAAAAGTHWRADHGAGPAQC